MVQRGVKQALSVFVVLTLTLAGNPCLGQVPGRTPGHEAVSPGNRAEGVDRIICTDGTVVEGRILDERPEEVRIETRRGTFTYQRVDVRRIERATPKGTPTPPPAMTPFFDVQRSLPGGALNPANPPAVAPVYRFAVNALMKHVATAVPKTTPAQKGSPASVAPQPNPAPATATSADF